MIVHQQGSGLAEIREAMRSAILPAKVDAVRRWVEAMGLSRTDRNAIMARAVEVVRVTRGASDASAVENFLVEYGLSSREGVALMRLADALIEDKIGATSPLLHPGRLLGAGGGSGLRHAGDSAFLHGNLGGRTAIFVYTDRMTAQVRLPA